MIINTFKIIIKGQVQGVGFRPYVYTLAVKNHLNGVVINDSSGVTIQFNSSKKIAEKFLETILEDAPVASEIISSKLIQISSKVFTDFKIGSSLKNKKLNIPLTPDFVICESCKAEIRDPNNRRYMYPFTTCVNCGPRFSITKNFPFERENTSLDQYKMCEKCSQEYINPFDRRYHSQTNSCQSCGIKLDIRDQNGAALKRDSEETLAKTAKIIEQGFIVAIKSTHGYVLCCDANNKKAIQKSKGKKEKTKKTFCSFI